MTRALPRPRQQVTHPPSAGHAGSALLRAAAERHPEENTVKTPPPLTTALTAPALLLTAPARAQTDIPAAQPAAPAPAPQDAAPTQELAPGAGATPAAPADAAAADAAGAAPRELTGITGTITDGATGEPLIEATVKVVGGGAGQVLTDVDGRYALALPPGTYDLRVFYDVYQGRRITGVRVEAGKPTRLDVKLAADADAVQEVVVEARADLRAEGAVLQERRKAAAVSDAISAQEIARTPDSSASDAVKRVVSATVVDGKFVLMRGLGGRYSSTLLNGATLPSPEPDEPSVPLDLFPTSLLANLNVVKSYTPDLPGSFGGGTLRIETHSYPASFELKPRLSVSGDSNSTFKDRLGFTGGSAATLGLGRGRGLPAGVPTDRPFSGRAGVGADALVAGARSFENVWSPTEQRALPNYGLALSMGDTLRPAGRRLGYLASVTYGRKQTVQTADVFQNVLRRDATTFEGEGPARTTLGTDSATVSGLLSAGYQLGRDHELTAFGFFTRAADARAQVAEGFSEADEAPYRGSRLQFVQRQLLFTQLKGFHRTGFLSDAEVDWQANYSRVTRDEPDTRDVVYGENTQGVMVFRDQPGSGDRFFGELGEDSTGASANLTVPLQAVQVKAGLFAQQSFRDFQARRFRFDVQSGLAPGATALPPEELFAAGNIGADSVLAEETTFPQDSYDAQLGVYAGYLSADARPVEALRLVVGARYELSRQVIDAQSPYARNAERIRRVKTYRDVLPSANAILALSPTVNLRAGYSYTLARPTFRELAPFVFFDFVRRRNVTGNDQLEQTRIHNGDLRAEWFVGDNEVLAATAFAKRFLRPIERIQSSANTTGDLTFTNAAGARAWGAELEARLSLGRLSRALSRFRTAANLTLIQSRIELGDAQFSQTSAERPMQGQSPYVVNLSLGYERPESGTEVAALYNVYGKRISEVGVETVPDVYEQAFHRVDLSVSQKLGGTLQLKLTAQNLLDSRVRLLQGGVPVLQYRPGVAFAASLGMSL